jgi:hypothetical protein
MIRPQTANSLLRAVRVGTEPHQTALVAVDIALGGHRVTGLPLSDNRRPGADRNVRGWYAPTSLGVAIWGDTRSTRGWLFGIA